MTGFIIFDLSFGFLSFLFCFLLPLSCILWMSLCVGIHFSRQLLLSLELMEDSRDRAVKTVEPRNWRSCISEKNRIWLSQTRPVLVCLCNFLKSFCQPSFRQRREMKLLQLPGMYILRPLNCEISSLFIMMRGIELSTRPDNLLNRVTYQNVPIMRIKSEIRINIWNFHFPAWNKSLWLNTKKRFSNDSSKRTISDFTTPRQFSGYCGVLLFMFVW